MTKILPKLSQKEAISHAKKYIDDRRDGKSYSLKTSFTRLNNHLMDGIEVNTIMTVAAKSGFGKSTIAKVIRNSVANLNKDKLIKQYCFNFEMTARQQIVRGLVTDVKIPMRQIYSLPDRLNDADYLTITNSLTDVQDYDVSYIEVSDNSDVIANTIYHYWKEDCKEQKAIMIVEWDHLLLTKGKQGDTEKSKIDGACEAMIYLKKLISSQGGSIIFIALSQLNRDIASTDRISNPSLHYPQTSDMFGASSIEFCSDYVLMGNIPAKLHHSSYGSENFPVLYKHHYYTKTKLDKEVIEQAYYLHLVKNRDGQSDIIIPLKNEMNIYNLEELSLDEFAERHKQFKLGNSIIKHTSK